MNKLSLILVIFCIYYLHSRVVFSDAKAEKWVVEHAQSELSGDEKACDDYSDDLEADIHSVSPTGTDDFKGGKAEICDYMKKALLAFKLIQANVNTSYDNFTVERGGFPWLTAKVSYTETFAIQAANTPGIKSVSKDTLVLKRTLSGVKIKSITSDGRIDK